jgi:hypothetical protein
MLRLGLNEQTMLLNQYRIYPLVFIPTAHKLVYRIPPMLGRRCAALNTVSLASSHPQTCPVSKCDQIPHTLKYDTLGNEEKMPRNKPRLQLALYARPKNPGTYHYALLIAPKNAAAQAPVVKHHVKNTLLVDDRGEATQPWRYERTVISNIEAEPRLLARIIIAKMAKPADEVQRILEDVPIYQVEDLEKAEDQTFTCKTWVRDVLRELIGQGALAANVGEWDVVEREALNYLDRKRAQGRWDTTWKGASGTPLMDLLDGKEIVE